MSLSPIATPLPGADAVARLLLHLESTPAAHLTATGLGVRLASGQVVTRVIAALGDGGREVLDAAEARLAARCLRDDYVGISQFEAWAEVLDAAAGDAERRADLILAGRDGAQVRFGHGDVDAVAGRAAIPNQSTAPQAQGTPPAAPFTPGDFGNNHVRLSRGGLDPLSTVASLWAIAASIGFVAGAVGWVLGRHGIAL